jgi:DNA-binding winged helix-turn-helix (wHTH) protein/Flp pilus assembly protein TadD
VATGTEIHFDGWVIDRVSGEASREERACRLPQQQLRILLELHDHAGEIVTRERLVQVLWPKGFVDFDNGLNVAIRKLRVALDDVGDQPRYIETIPRVGYRFIGTPATPVAAGQGAGMRATASRWTLAAVLLTLVIALGVGWWLGKGGASAPAYVPSIRAHEFYLEGLRQRARRDINGNLLAREAFQAAVKEDPNYPQAWAAYGEVLHGAVIRQMVPPADAVDDARLAARRAIDLDPNLVEAHVLLAHIHLEQDKDFAAARSVLDKGFAITDRNARLWHHHAMWHGHQGHVEESLAALRRARELEPATLLFAGNYALVLYQARRYEQVIDFLEPLLAANPSFSSAHILLGRALAATGDLPGALEHLQLANEIGHFQSDFGVLYARMGRREDALREIERIQARGREGFGVAYDLAMIHVALGDVDQGCEYLRAAVTDRSLLVNWMRLEPLLDPLRGRQCFADAESRLYGPKNQ